MEKYAWFALCGIEIVYVGATLSGELFALAVLRPIIRFERKLHALPDDRFYGIFATPTLTYVVGLGGGLTTSMIGEGAKSTFVGLLFTGVVTFGLFQHQFREATGNRPRPAARARWRRQAADISRVLSAASAPSGRDRVLLSRAARRLGAIGARVTEAAASQTWRGAFRAEPWGKRGCIIVSIALPAILVGWAALTHCVTIRPFVGHAVFFVVLVGAVASPVLRRVRYRSELLEIGRELQESSRRLSDELSRTSSQRPRPLRIRSTSLRRHPTRHSV